MGGRVGGDRRGGAQVTQTFVLVNESTEPSLTPAVMAAIAAVLQIQNNEHFAPAWGQLPAKVAVAGDETGADDADHVTRFVDENTEEPDAIAWHTINAKGQTELVVCVNACRREAAQSGGTLLDAIFGAASHEICEACGNPFVNLYVDAPDGSGEFPYEASDWVQADAFPIAVPEALRGPGVPDQFMASNFVRPPFFDAGTDETGLDHMGLVKTPFEVRPGGYTEKRTGGAGGLTTMIFGAEVSEKVKARKLSLIEGRNRTNPARVPPPAPAAPPPGAPGC